MSARYETGEDSTPPEWTPSTFEAVAMALLTVIAVAGIGAFLGINA